MAKHIARQPDAGPHRLTLAGRGLCTTDAAIKGRVSGSNVWAQSHSANSVLWLGTDVGEMENSVRKIII